MRAVFVILLSAIVACCLVVSSCSDSTTTTEIKLRTLEGRVEVRIREGYSSNSAVQDPKMYMSLSTEVMQPCKNWSIDKDGYASLPVGPGLGCEIDEAKLEELARNPSPPGWPTRGRLSDGSISDY